MKDLDILKVGIAASIVIGLFASLLTTIIIDWETGIAILIMMLITGISITNIINEIQKEKEQKIEVKKEKIKYKPVPKEDETKLEQYKKELTNHDEKRKEIESELTEWRIIKKDKT